MKEVKKVTDNNSSKVNSIKVEISSIFEILKFNAKSALTSKMMLGIVFALMIFAMMIPVVLFPWTSTANFSYFIMVTIPLLIYLGWFSFNIKNSTLYYSINLSGIGRVRFYLSQLITLWVVAMGLTFLFLIVFNILSSFNLLLLDYANFGGKKISGSINKNIYSIINLFYIANVNALLTFSIYFLFRNIVKTKNQYYSLVFGLIVLTFIFGGILNGYFDSAIVVDENGIVILSDATVDKDWSSDPGDLAMWYPEAARGLFPMEMFKACLFFPYFSIGQMFTYGYTLIGNEMPSTFNLAFKEVSGFFTNLPQNTFFNFSWEYSWEWTMVFIMPYIWILISFIIGITFSKGKL